MYDHSLVGLVLHLQDMSAFDSASDSDLQHCIDKHVVHQNATSLQSVNWQDQLHLLAVFSACMPHDGNINFAEQMRIGKGVVSCLYHEDLVLSAHGITHWATLAPA